MTNYQKKLLTERLLKDKEPWHGIERRQNVHLPKEFIYHCDSCQTHFTEAEKHLHQNRTFTTWQDLGDCKEALEKDGLWDEFHELTHDNTVASAGDFWNYDVLTEKHWSEFDRWLFRPTDENGGPHFCRLVAEFMEEK